MSAGKEISIETRCREDLTIVCHLAYKRGLVSGTEGNFSFKVDEDQILVTPRNSHKGLIETNNFVLVDSSGNITGNGNKQPTSELALHLEAYKKRPDIRAVVHAHSASTVSFSVAGLDFTQPVIPEIIVLLGEVPTVPYCEPGTKKLSEVSGGYLEKHDAVILERHGAVTVGKDIYEAYFKMESLEHASKIMLSASQLGKIKILEKHFVEELIKQRHKIYGEEVQLRDGEKLFSIIL